MIKLIFWCVLTAVKCFTNHIEVFLIKATQDKEQVSTQLAEQLLRTHVLCKPFDHVTLRQEVPLTEQVLETSNHIIETSSKRHCSAGNSVSLVSLSSYPDEELGQDRQFGHGTASKCYSCYRSQAEEQFDLTSQLWQCGECYECWEMREGERESFYFHQALSMCF